MNIKSLTLEGILKILRKQWFRRLTSGHNYFFPRLLLSPLYYYNSYYLASFTIVAPCRPKKNNYEPPETLT